ncbi:MAG: hypothetical protein PHD31_01260, partial [Candidatus Pacebacteria bacterium]|nr:hypothetical protein [Candidatus Paceibacterota bacterium]
MSSAQRLIAYYNDSIKLLKEAGVSSVAMGKLPMKSDIIGKTIALINKHKVSPVSPFVLVMPDKYLSIEEKLSMMKYGGLKGSINLDLKKVSNTENVPSVPYVLFLPQKGNSVGFSPLNLEETLSLFVREPSLLKKGGVTIKGSYFVDEGIRSGLALLRCSNFGPNVSIVTPKDRSSRPALYTPSE